MPKSMRVMYDYEFLEDGSSVRPISVGMSREDGKEYYAVYSDMPTLEIAQDEWLMANVMSSIGHTPLVSHTTYNDDPIKDFILDDPNAKARTQIRGEIQDFVSDIKPEWWAWYGAYDHVCLCQTFGKMIWLPTGWPMFTRDLKQFVMDNGNPHLPSQPEGKHNALDDAKFNWVRYNFVRDDIIRRAEYRALNEATGYGSLGF